MTREEARAELHAAANDFGTKNAEFRQRGATEGESPPSATRLEIAAMQFARAMRDLADGVDYAKRQAEQEKRRGVQLCPSCMQVKVVWAHDGKQGRWVDPKSFQPHFCRSGR